MIGCKYCTKCGKPITLDYYPFNRSVLEELEILVNEHSLHLCTTCIKSFPICDASRVIFGQCIGNDNVIECNAYINK